MITRRAVPFVALTAAVLAAAACIPSQPKQASGMDMGMSMPMSSGTGMGSASTGPGGPADASSSGGGGLATFKTDCAFTHQAMDDPIVFPNRPGASHLHTFFGSTATNAFTTGTKLVGTPTTCGIKGDSSGYWIPMLYQSGKPVAPASILVYYRAGSHRVPSKTQPLPVGFREIAGDGHATKPLPTAAIFWHCGGSGATLAAPPSCGAKPLAAQIRFPDCWDGHNLDSADHRSHVAYTVNGFCPMGYPVQIPLVEFDIQWKTPGGSGVTLASGAPYTLHADVQNGWNQATQAGLVKSCLDAGKVCGKL